MVLELSVVVFSTRRPLVDCGLMVVLGLSTLGGVMVSITRRPLVDCRLAVVLGLSTVGGVVVSPTRSPLVDCGLAVVLGLSTVGGVVVSPTRRSLVDCGLATLGLLVVRLVSLSVALAAINKKMLYILKFSLRYIIKLWSGVLES